MEVRCKHGIEVGKEDSIAVDLECALIGFENVNRYVGMYVCIYTGIYFLVLF